MGNNLRRKPYPQGYHGENRHLSNSSKACQSYQAKGQAQFLISSRRGTMIVLLLYEMFDRLVSSWGCNFWKVLETLGINLTKESSNAMLHFLTAFCFLFFWLRAGEVSLLHTPTAVQLLPTHFPHHSGLYPLKQWYKALEVVPSWIKGTTTIQEVVIWRLILKKHRHLHRCSYLTMSSFAAYDTDRPCSLRRWLWTSPHPHGTTIWMVTERRWEDCHPILGLFNTKEMCPSLYEWSFQRRSVTGLECVFYIIRHDYKILWPKATLVSIRSNSLLGSVAWRGQKTESGLQMWQNHWVYLSKLVTYK